MQNELRIKQSRFMIYKLRTYWCSRLNYFNYTGQNLIPHIGQVLNWQIHVLVRHIKTSGTAAL